MKKATRLIFTVAMLLTMAVTSAMADDQLILSFKTTLYADDGESNSFSMSLGSTEPSTYVDIDCGAGKEEFEVQVAVLDSLDSINGSLYTGKVSKEGIVRVYGDPTKIDYINLSGCSITDIEFAKGANIQVMNLEHNSLGKLDINSLDSLKILYLLDNPFDVEPFNVTSTLKDLVVLEMGELGHVSPDFSLARFPNLMSLDAYHSLDFKASDTSHNPYLTRYSVEMTQVENIDVSKNSNLMILNVNDSRVTSLDVSKNNKLQELYCNHSSGVINTDCKLKELDVTNNENLTTLYCAGNGLDTLDVSVNYYLSTLSAPKNNLRGIAINPTDNPKMYSVNISNNKMDFVTLPSPQETWGEYYYAQQDMDVNRSYKVGDVIDLSKRVLRYGSSTNAVLYLVPTDDPTNMVELDSTFYSYDAGKVTLKKDTTEQMCVAFYNSLLSDYELYTTKFKVYSVAEFGKDIAAISLPSTTASGRSVNMAVGIVGATEDRPVTVKVDFGDGTTKSYDITEEMPEDMNITGKRTGVQNIVVYVPQDVDVSCFRAEGFHISNFNASKLTQLRELSIVDCDLYTINLQYNAKLEKLQINENYNFTTLDLKGPSGSYYFYKSKLKRLDLANNAIANLTYDDLYAERYIDLSNNALTEFDATDCDYLKEINISDNKLEILQFNNSDSLEVVNASGNYLYYIYIPEEAPMREYNVSSNSFAFTDLPDNLWNLDDQHFIYAPQQPLSIPSTSPGVDLSTLVYPEDGNKTTFTWKTATGKTLVEGTDYTNNNGSFKFLEPALNIGKVYCEMTNSEFPQFTGLKVLRTSETQPIAMPTIELASFTTTEDNDTVNLSLSATTYGTSLYIDWAGDGNVTQYTLGSESASQYQAITKKNTKVRVLAAERGDNFKVFSMSDAKLSYFDGSGLTDATLIGVENAGLDSIKLPASANLKELKLSNNNFKDFDLTPYPGLYYFAMNGNQLETFDLGQAPKMALAYLANNKLKKVTYKNNTNLWNLDLSSNQFTEVSFDGAPNIEQLWLNGNKLTHVDLSSLKVLRVIDLVANKFTFATLPTNTDSKWAVYRYDNQADMDVTPNGMTVDLSSQAMVGDSVTTYRWFIGKPEYNSDNELEGEELSEEEYTIVNGVTTFNYDQEVDNLVCVMTNPMFSSMTLYTTPITVSPSKQGDVNGDGTVDISDVNAIISVVCGGAKNSRADVNGDGNVDISDVNAVIAIICGVQS